MLNPYLDGTHQERRLPECSRELDSYDFSALPTLNKPKILEFGPL